MSTSGLLLPSLRCFRFCHTSWLVSSQARSRCNPQPLPPLPLWWVACKCSSFRSHFAVSHLFTTSSTYCLFFPFLPHTHSISLFAQSSSLPQTSQKQQIRSHEQSDNKSAREQFGRPPPHPICPNPSCRFLTPLCQLAYPPDPSRYPLCWLFVDATVPWRHLAGVGVVGHRDYKQSCKRSKLLEVWTY